MDAVLERRLARRAEQQLGLITTAQLHELGLSDRQIQRCRAQGRLVEVYQGVVRIGGAVITPHASILAATLATGGAASHRSAGYLYRVYEWRSKPEVLVANGLSNRAGLIVHRTRSLADVDITTVDGIPCTTIERTLIDLGAVVKPFVLRSTLERSLRERKVELNSLITRFFELARKGRPGIAAMRCLLREHEGGLGMVDSDLEALLLHVMSRHNLPTPATQVKVMLDGWCYRIDVGYPHLKIAIEGDGFGVHSMRPAFENDRSRQNRLMLHGWLVLRFTWRQLCYEPDVVAAQIAEALRLRSART